MSKIAVFAGASSHYGVLKMLKEVGIDPNEVEILDMVPPDAKSALETGQVDAWAVWPHFVEGGNPGVRISPARAASLGRVTARNGAVGTPDASSAMVLASSVPDLGLSDFGMFLDELNGNAATDFGSLTNLLSLV